MESLKKNLWLISAILAVALLLGCFPWEYGYYRFVRIVVFIGSVLAIVGNKEEGFAWRNLLLGLFAILFNPILPILMTREIWIVVDAVGAVWFAYCVYVFRKQLKNNEI